MKISYNNFGIEFEIDDIKSFFSEIKENIIIPKNSKNTIGIIIAIDTENDKEKSRIENDIINELKLKLTNHDRLEDFKIIKLPQNISHQIYSDERANSILIKSKSHFILWGKLFERKIEGKENYIIKLNGGVCHAPISKYDSQLFAQEFSEILPKLTFPTDDELIGFEFTEKWIRYVIKYIIGKAAFLSNDISFSEELSCELENDLLQIKENVPIIESIKEKIKILISQIITIRISINYNIFSITRDRTYILKNKDTLDKIEKIDCNNYPANLNRSIYYYFNNEIDKGIEELKKLSSIKDTTWRYNLCFLLFYRNNGGDIDSALEIFRKVPYGITTGNVYNEVEIFIGETLNEFPEKLQFYFLRGLINYKIKNDYSLAKKDFDTFIEKNNEEKMKILKNLATKYVEQIKNL